METKLSIYFVCLLGGLVPYTTGISAQITVGLGKAPVKAAILDIKGQEADEDNVTSKTGGLVLPRVKLVSLTTLQPFISNDDPDWTVDKQDVLKTEHVGLMVYNLSTASPFSEGIYVWNGTTWTAASGGSGTEPWQVSGRTDQATSNDQNIYQMGSVSIGNSATANQAVILNVDAGGKGVLLPRIELNSPTDITTIPNPPVGLLVYSKGTNPAFTTTGYLYWSGTEWKMFNTSTSTMPVIAGLNCMGATLSPKIYKKDEPYTGIVKISYTGGNGSFYTGGSSFTIHGLTFTLQDGKLEKGIGELVFGVEGTPDISSPDPCIIPINPVPDTEPGIKIPFWSGNCEVTVGQEVNADIANVAIMDYMKFVTDEGTNTKGFSVECTTPDGLYTVRAFLKHSNQTAAATATNNTQSTGSLDNNNIQLRNNSNQTVTIMWNYITAWGTDTMQDSGGNLKVPSKQWGGGVGNTWTSVTTAAGYAPWGNGGIYNAANSGPEHRRYSWIDTSATTKVAYTATIMAGMDPGATNTEATKQKVFIKIEQITAP